MQQTCIANPQRLPAADLAPLRAHGPSMSPPSIRIPHKDSNRGSTVTAARLADKLADTGRTGRKASIGAALDFLLLRQ